MTDLRFILRYQRPLGIGEVDTVRENRARGKKTVFLVYFRVGSAVGVYFQHHGYFVYVLG